MSKSDRRNLRLTPRNQAATDVASEDDRRWFEQHPGIEERVRPPFPHECDFTGGICVAVQVTQIAPGIRVRIPALAS
jgi:hypothetical protein